jgi:trimethylamine--corrinoid protein Co-methyltransferase
MATTDLRWSGLLQQMSPSMTVLTQDQKQILIDAAFEILETVGNRVGSKEALELFRKAGCRIEPLDDEGEKVFFPQSLIEECIRRAPKRMVLYDRTGEPALYCQGRNSYFSPTGVCPQMWDPYSGERRTWKKEDIANAVKIADALPHIDFMCYLGSLADEYGEDTFVHEVHAMITNTTKPFIYVSEGMADTKAICEMAAVVAGGWDRLRERPFILQYDEVLSPLKHKNHAFDKFMYLAGEGLPIRYGPLTMSGVSSPVTLPGAVAQSLAEALVGLIACQLKRPGVPFMVALLPGIMDLKLGTLSSGAPEYHLFHAMFTEVVHELRLPVMVTAGITDSKVVDAQAGVEILWSYLCAALVGSHLNIGAGSLESHLIGSFEHLVLSNECISAVRRFMRGAPINDVSLAMQAISEVGAGLPEMIFIDHPHTMENYVDEQWQPEVFNRNNFQVWTERGQKTTQDVCNQKVRHIIENHTPEPLPADVLVTLEEIARAATSEDTLAVAKTAKSERRRRKFRAA